MQTIKTGRTGRRPRVARVVWRGTASVLLYGESRESAALAETDRGDMAAILLEGEWWDARCIPSREWEDDGGELVTGDVARRIDQFLATATDGHLKIMRRLNVSIARKAITRSRGNAPRRTARRD